MRQNRENIEKENNAWDRKHKSIKNIKQWWK